MIRTLRNGGEPSELFIQKINPSFESTGFYRMSDITQNSRDTPLLAAHSFRSFSELRTFPERQTRPRGCTFRTCAVLFTNAICEPWVGPAINKYIIYLLFIFIARRITIVCTMSRRLYNFRSVVSGPFGGRLYLWAA